MPDHPTFDHVPTADPHRTGSIADPAAATGGDAPPPFPTPTPASGPRYALGEEIARGGMGVIYRATDTAFDREVAVKVLQERFGIGSGAAQRFLDEARITGQLQHPAIPPVHDVGTLPDGRPFLAMKLIQGDTLDTLLNRRPDPAHDRGRFVAVFEQICQAVGYAHSHRVIHRDLKPANVMVGGFGEVQVMDWGLAKVLANPEREREGSPADATSRPDTEADPDRTTDHRPANESTDERTHFGQALGTPAYMPPEQARGEVDHIDRRSDVFALGGILCAVLTGKPPYSGANAPAVVRKAAAGELAEAFARLDASGADAELVALCKRCLAADPVERPADGGAVAGLVAAYRAEVEARLRRAETERAEAAVRTLEERKRRRVRQGLFTAVGLLVLGGAGFGWWADYQANQRRLDQERADGVLRAEQAAFDTERKLKGEQARDRATNLLVLAGQARKEYRYAAAESNLREAGELAASLAPDMADAVGQAKADLAFVRDLDAIRMYRSTVMLEEGGKYYFDQAKAPGQYRQVFAARGPDVATDPAAAGDRVRKSAVRDELVTALDDWAILEPDTAVRDKVLAALRRADEDSGAAPFRDPAVWADKAKLEALAAKVDLVRFSPGAVVAVADVMARQKADAAQLLRHALSLYPREFLIAFYLGQLLDDKNPERVGAYRAARAIRPDNPIVLNNLGDALRVSGDVPGALAAYREAIRLNPDSAPFHVNLGLSLRASGDVPGAIAAYREAVRLDPKLALAHGKLGTALAESGDVPGAIAAYREGVRLDPKFAAAHYNLGLTLRASRDLPGALAAYREAVRLDPKFVRAHNALGTALRESGDLPGALAAYQEAIRLDPKFASAHYNLGTMHFQQMNYPEAIACARAAITADPTHANAHAILGDLLMRTGDMPGARAALTEAARLDKRWAGMLAKLPQVAVAPPPREVMR